MLYTLIDARTNDLHLLIVVKELLLDLLSLNQILLSTLIQYLFLLFQLFNNFRTGCCFTITGFLIFIQDYLGIAFTNLNSILSVLFVKLYEWLFKLDDVIGQVLYLLLDFIPGLYISPSDVTSAILWWTLFWLLLLSWELFINSSNHTVNELIDLFDLFCPIDFDGSKAGCKCWVGTDHRSRFNGCTLSCNRYSSLTIIVLPELEFEWLDFLFKIRDDWFVSWHMQVHHLFVSLHSHFDVLGTIGILKCVDSLFELTFTRRYSSYHNRFTITAQTVFEHSGQFTISVWYEWALLVLVTQGVDAVGQS